MEKKKIEPVICVLGMTGCGKSTFCHLITGSDPRLNKEKYLASSGNSSVTTKIEVREGQDWFDEQGSMTLIDCPGLSDSGGND